VNHSELTMISVLPFDFNSLSANRRLSAERQHRDAINPKAQLFFS
jgi:hypothetical protein